jgi:hypothetical protein
MTNKIISLVVALDKEIRIDDIEDIMKAICMIKHVSSVTENIFTGADMMNAWSFKQYWLDELTRNIITLIMEARNHKQ